MHSYRAGLSALLYFLSLFEVEPSLAPACVHSEEVTEIDCQLSVTVWSCGDSSQLGIDSISTFSCCATPTAAPLSRLRPPPAQ